MMGFGLLVMALFWGLVVALIAGGGVLAFRNVSASQTERAVSDRTPRELLDERLARGDISVTEFERIRARLGD